MPGLHMRSIKGGAWLRFKVEVKVKVKVGCWLGGWVGFCGLFWFALLWFGWLGCLFAYFLLVANLTILTQLRINNRLASSINWYVPTKAHHYKVGLVTFVTGTHHGS